MRSAPAIGFDYRPSAWPPRVSLTLLALALLGIAGSGLAPALKLATGVAVMLAGTATMLRLRRIGVTGLGIGQTWRLYRRDREESATLLSYRLVGPLVLLTLKSAGGVEHLLLAPDNCDADTRRRVRMRLLAGHASTADP